VPLPECKTWQLPVAIASLAEVNSSAVPLKLLSLFDPSEPLFNQEAGIL